MKQTIDLRKISRISGERPGVVLSVRENVLPEAVEWLAPEYDKSEMTPLKFFLLAAAAAVLTVFGILDRSYFFAALIALSFVVLMMFSAREPRVLKFSITKEGVAAGGKLYEFPGIKSFWVFSRPGAKELSLETARGFSPFVRLPLGDADPEKIRETLVFFLPEKEHQRFASEEIARLLKI